MCYYAEDLPRLSDIVKESFEVLEEDDKTESQGIDRFGYGGIHFLVKLGNNSSGARYDDLKAKVCEVQLRTVMQDAWAVVSHHLLYKREEDVPTQLKRNVNALAGALDAADIAFQAIKRDRDSYLEQVSTFVVEREIDKIAINSDSLMEYLKQRFPNVDVEESGTTVDGSVKTLLGLKYRFLGQVDKLLEQTEKGRQWFRSQVDGSFVTSSTSEVQMAIYIANPAFRVANCTPKFAELYGRASQIV